MARGALCFQSFACVIAACLATDPFATLVNEFISEASNSSIGLEFLRQAQEYEAAEFPDTTPAANSRYDFIIIGGGTAGAIVAARLSEISEVDVLLIEAGGNENLFQDIPALATLLFLTDINWNYKTEPSDSYCLGMTDNMCLWAKGKVMGGSSVMNHMIATRGCTQNYDDWAAQGNTGWSYEDVLPYFKKLENMTIAEFREDEEIHGTSGPESISYPTYYTDAGSSFYEAGQELGFRTDYDCNGRSQSGFTYVQKNTINGSRLTSNRAYLHPARNRTNLHVTKNSLATRILIDSETMKAYGVEFVKNNQTITVNISKEIILSAGSIASPQLLMLSGIGPEEHLLEMDIPVIKDAPVGENLMDHVTFGGLVFLTNQTVSVSVDSAFSPESSYFKDYVENGAGALTTSFNTEALGFYNESSPLDPNRCQNSEMGYMGFSIASTSQSQSLFGISESLWNETFQDIEGANSWTALPVVLNPQSRGKILLSSNDINVQPKIIPNYFDDTEDVRIAIEAIKMVIRISETEAMQKFGSQLYNVSLPGCKDDQFGSDEYWECALRTLTFTMWHPAGTCKMGPEDESTAVVNPSLQVIGVENLRVVDASIMPLITSGHIEIPTMMIAEKACDMIKEYWGY